MYICIQYIPSDIFRGIFSGSFILRHLRAKQLRKKPEAVAPWFNERVKSSEIGIVMDLSLTQSLTGDTANCFVRAEIQSNEGHHPVPHRSFVRMRFCHIDSTSWKLVRCPKLHNAISDITASGNYVCITAIAKLNLHWTSKRQKHIFLSTRDTVFGDKNLLSFALPRFQRHMSWQPICEASSHLANIGLIPCDLGHPHGLKVPIATLFPTKTRRITRSSNQKKWV